MLCSRIISVSVIVTAICLGSCGALPATLRRRQVVQPTWLLHPSKLATGQAAEVRVTPQNLKEAAALRASIQKAVREGTYVVPTDPKQYQIALSQLGYNTGMVGASGQMPMQMPMVYPTMPTMPNASWWQPRLFFA